MLLEEHLPRIQKIIKEKLGTLSTDALQNEVVMRSAFRRLYQALPRMIRLTVGEQGFVDFCMTNRDRLLNVRSVVSEKFSVAETTEVELTNTGTEIESEFILSNNQKATDLLATAQRVFLPTYAPTLIFTHSKGARIYDINGNEYIDLGSGISVNSLGHLDSDLQQALNLQAGKIWHSTNLYLTEPAIKLAEELVNSTFADRIFFCNSGAEANESAIKIARKFSSLNHSADKREILTFEGSFHGRTLATITATAQPKYQKGFEPLPAGFRYCPFNDFIAAEEMIGSQTCAVLIEPIQGEGGVNPVKPGFLSHLRKLCNEHNALLIFDEIQCGMGRTGKLFGYQWEKPEDELTSKASENKFSPDIITMAKALGGGLPIGAMLCTEKVAQTFKPGDHGTTFGGNPIVTAVAGAAFQKINSLEMMEKVLTKGQLIRKHLEELNQELSLFEEIRGRGMMLGAVLTNAWKGKASSMVAVCQEQGVLVLNAGPDVLRFLPPLNISTSELQTGLELVTRALKKLHEIELTSSKDS